MSYHEISSAQIVLCEPDTVQHFVREVRGGWWSRQVEAVQALLDELVHGRRGQPWPSRRTSAMPDPRIIALALVAVSLGVALCFVLASGPATPSPTVISASPLSGLALPAPLPLAPPAVARERVLDSEPHGALVYRGGILIGTTPFLYDTPDDSPLGAVDLRLSGYRTEHRYLDPGTPRVLVVALRRR